MIDRGSNSISGSSDRRVIDKGSNSISGSSDRRVIDRGSNSISGSSDRRVIDRGSNSISGSSDRRVIARTFCFTITHCSFLFLSALVYDVVVCLLLNVSATCECISGTDLLRQFYVLPH